MTRRIPTRPLRRNRLVWVDCEMTGLDPERHVLLEIATLITDDALEPVAEGPVIAIRQPPSELKKMDAWCRRTHTASGLLQRVRETGTPLAEAERRTLDFVRRHCAPGTAPLCGNSVGQDRRFLARFMPTLHAHFHYQSVDVSSIKQLVTRWYRGRFVPPKKQKRHQALADILESVAELRYYRDTVFIPSGPTRAKHKDTE